MINALKILSGTSMLSCFLGCATAMHELWPPPDGVLSVRIVVSLDAWHAVIALPIDPKDIASKRVYEEWGYAERAWYLEGRQGITGAIRALLWPTEGVVEVGVHDRIWADRSPQLPADVFAFELSEVGYGRLRDYLQSTIASHEQITVIGGSRFYRARPSYHLFHHCHQYAAKALREAGLPVSPWAAITRGAFAEQLRRAQRIAQAADTAPPEVHLSAERADPNGEGMESGRRVRTEPVKMQGSH
jgi:uncharacterized protein DUF2459